MSHASPVSELHRHRNTLAEAAGEALRSTLSAQTREAWTLRPPAAQSDAGPIAIPGPTVAIQLSGEFEGKLLLTLDTAASSLEKLQGVQAQEPEQLWLALVTASQALLAQELVGISSAECLLHSGAPENDAVIRIHLQSSQGTQLIAGLTVDAALANALGSLKQPASADGSAQSRTAGEGPRIDRVIDVPLSVTLRFGQRQLTLREVLALGTGSLVELDRQVEEPVDLVLGDRIIARGEVVVIDGNYGLRVTEVVEGAAHRIQRLEMAAAQEEVVQKAS